MRRLFIGNFDFEHALADGAGSRTQPNADEVMAALAGAWLSIADESDAVLVPGDVDPADLAGLARLGNPVPHFVTDFRNITSPAEYTLVPWGWTDRLRQAAHTFGFHVQAPPQDVIRRVNARSFRWKLEEEWGVSLPGSALVRTLDELEEAVRKAGTSPAGWVLKAEFGMSGRERILGRGPSLSESQAGWARRRLAGQGALVFEPWVERLAEAGIQLEIPPSGPAELVGVTPLLTDRSGSYRGSRLGGRADELSCWQEAVTVALRVAERLQQIGYFGPLGIDAVRYRDAEGNERLRPLQDLNARFTMGRLALGFRRLLPPGACGSWLHVSREQAEHCRRWIEQVGWSDEVTLVRTSFSRVGARVLRPVALLLLASTEEQRAAVEQHLLTEFRGVSSSSLEPEV